MRPTPTLVVLANLGLPLVGCGSVPPEEALQGDYVIEGAAYCEVMEPGQPLDVAGLDGEITVRSTAGATTIDGCLAVIDVATEICSGCASDSCELCLLPPHEGSSWSLGPRYPDSLALPSCGLTDPRGGAAYDLLISGQRIDGTLERTADGLQLELSFPGMIRTGVTGADRAAAIRCSVHAIPAP